MDRISKHTATEEAEEEIEKQKSRQKQFKKMTEEPIGKLLLSLSVPTVISMMVTNVYNIVDTAFVGTLGTSQSGATGVVFGFMAILQAAAFMCGQGAGSTMSRKLGQKNLEEATIYASTGFFMSFFLGVFLGAGSLIFIDPLLDILGSSATIAPYAKTYILYIAIAAPFFTSSLTLNNLLRYEGKAKLGTIGMMSGAVLNIGLDALLMFVFDMGIAGAGIATAAAQALSFCILVFMFVRGKTQTSISIRRFTRNIKDVLNIAATGFPSLLRQGLSSIATMMLNTYARGYGDEAVSAMSCVSRISFFAMATAIGIGQGFQPISSFNYGAGKTDRVKKAFWYAVIGEEIVLLIFALPMFGFAEPLIRIMRDADDVVAIGVRALRLMCVGQLFIPITMMVEMGFQSIGKRALASFSSSLRSGILFIPTIAILSNLRGLSGIQEAQPLTFVLASVCGIVLSRVYLKTLDEPK